LPGISLLLLLDIYLKTATQTPTTAPTSAPIIPDEPTLAPIVKTADPTEAPSVAPTAATVTSEPTLTPVVGPTTSTPTVTPTVTPTASPTVGPTVTPTLSPTVGPTVAPTTSPTVAPNVAPTIAPTISPTIAPTSPSPSASPTTRASDNPSVSPTAVPIPLVPTPTPVQRLRITDYYISFVTDTTSREPTQEEYDEMLSRINGWFEMRFTEVYANDPNIQFLGAETSNDFTIFGLNNQIPPRPAEFNIYMNFDFSEFTYSEQSMVPTTADVFEVMRSSITQDFILQVARTYTGTPFASTIEVFFAASELTAPP
jgi:hypothetical protein